MTTLDLTADIIDVRDIIERVEELENDRNNHTDDDGEENPEEWDDINREECEELATLRAILNDLKGYGGDEQWRGDWYPVTLIRDSYFTEYIIDFAKDVGDIPQNLPSYLEIDWEATARNIQQDYTSTEIDGQTYWHR